MAKVKLAILNTILLENIIHLLLACFPNYR